VLRLNSRNQSPPDGFQFIDADGWQAHKENPSVKWNFGLLCAVIQRHRRHTGKGSVELSDIEIQADEQNAKRIHSMGATRLVHDVGPPPLISQVFRPSMSKQGPIVVRRMMALGDVLAATCVARKLAEIGYDVIFQSVPAAHCVLKQSPYVHACETDIRQPNIDLDGVYERDPNRTTKHFYDMFTDAANQQLAHTSVQLPKTNLAPKLITGNANAERDFLNQYPRPWVMICPKSDNWPHRTVPNDIWNETAAQMHGTCFWLGRHPATGLSIVNLHVTGYEQVMLYISCADLLVTVDTGPMHVAAALNIPTVVVNQSSFAECHLSDQQDFITVKTDLVCLNCQQDRCPIDPNKPPCQDVPPELISRAVNLRAKASVGNGVSAVIPVYRPDPNRLNRCLEAVLDQVDEVIVTVEKDGVVPSSMKVSPKIRVVVKQESGIGFGRNVNFGARHANHKWLLILNDDCFLDPTAVEKLKECATEGVGIVGHLLFYEDGTVQHGGKYREPGAKGWGHIDYRSRTPTIKEPVEMENVCGASILVRRKAFYEAGGFDDQIFAYCDDDDLCMKVRQAGWKVMYTPHAKGIHQEHQSMGHNPNIPNVIKESCRIFEAKWGWWFWLNRDNNLGKFQ
jgi:GT2 family glycosyltransferase